MLTMWVFFRTVHRGNESIWLMSVLETESSTRADEELNGLLLCFSSWEDAKMTVAPRGKGERGILKKRMVSHTRRTPGQSGAWYATRACHRDWCWLWWRWQAASEGKLPAEPWLDYGELHPLPINVEAFVDIVIHAVSDEQIHEIIRYAAESSEGECILCHEQEHTKECPITLLQEHVEAYA